MHSREILSPRERAGSGPAEAGDMGTGMAGDKCGICEKPYEEPHVAASVSLWQRAAPTWGRPPGRESLFSAVSRPVRYRRRRRGAAKE